MPDRAVRQKSEPVSLFSFGGAPSCLMSYLYDWFVLFNRSPRLHQGEHVARAPEPRELEGGAREFSPQIIVTHIAVNSIEFCMLILG
jgi:hypothetical protein